MKFAKTLKRISALCVAAAVMSAPASAHRMWMLPSTFTLSGDEQYVTVDGAISNDLFFPNHVALSLGDVTVTQPDGQQAKIENPAELQFRSVFDLKLDQQGTYRIAETGAMYFANWKEDGEAKRMRGTWDRMVEMGLDKRDGVTLMQSRRRVETYVTLGAPSTGAFEPTKKGIELQPVTHPNDVYVGEPIEFKMLLNGDPAKGMQVEVVQGQDRYRDGDDLLKVTADDNGVISFQLDVPGQYWLSADAGGKTQAQGREMTQMLSYAGTIEALPN